MGGAGAVAAGKSMDPRRIVVANRTPEKARALAAQVGCAAAEHNEDVASHAEYIVLGVKPNVMRDVVRGLSPTLAACVRAGKPRVLVSIAAGIPVAAIKACLEVDVPVIRVMPNTPVLVGQGMLLLASSAQDPGEVSEERFAEFQRMFAAAGDFERIPESARILPAASAAARPLMSTCLSRPWPTARCRPACPAGWPCAWPPRRCWAVRRWCWRPGNTPAR